MDLLLGWIALILDAMNAALVLVGIRKDELRKREAEPMPPETPQP